MYKLLYLLKRVEYQINPKFQNTIKILNELKHNQFLETLFLTTSLIITVFILVISIYFLTAPTQPSNKLDIIYFAVGFVYVILNIVILGQFCKMAWFYIKILSYNNEISARKAKIFVVLNMVTILITLFRYYVHG